MASAVVWKNVNVTMQSAIAAAKTITSISQAATAVVSCTAHGYSNGDIVYLEINGMRQLNERAFRVAGVTTDSFQLEGINSVSFDAFASGTAQKVTLGNTITTATSISASGGEFDMIDITTIHDNARSQMPGLPSAISFSMEHLWDVSNAGQAALKLASDNQDRRVFKFQFGSGGKVIYFAGYVGFTGLPGGQAQDKVTTQCVITMNGTPSYYAS
jgi:hypothetical protein